MLKPYIFTCLLIATAKLFFAQDVNYAHEVVNTLASENMYGRGYVSKGDKLAAAYIKNELMAAGTKPFDNNYYQTVSFPINTFPTIMEAIVNAQILNPVFDYVVSPDCKSIKGSYELVYLPAAADTNQAIFDSITAIDYSGKFIVAPFEKRHLSDKNPFKAAGVIVLRNQLSWWLYNGYQVAETPILVIRDSILINKPTNIEVNIKNKFYAAYKSQNVAAYIPGAVQPDSFIVFTAHYDHLGTMGKGNVFCGANDNASGTAMVLDLARYYSSDSNARYTMVFLFFTGEEAGLLGSHYFANHPLIDLRKVKALINLDMVGSGSEGIGIVNGEENAAFINKFKAINNVENYFPRIKVRNNACNSDHCFFAKMGLPALFIYTEGKEHKEYHNLKDAPEILPFTKYNELFQLLVKFGE